MAITKAAALYDAGTPIVRSRPTPRSTWPARPAINACETAVLTHGGMGYAKEYHVERLLRESLIPRIAPVSRELILCFVAERVLGLPKSY